MKQIEEPKEPGSFALFNSGFRPFFLLGGLYGAVLVAWWARTYDDTLTGPSDAPLFASRRFSVLYRGPTDLSGRLYDASQLGAPDRS